MFSQKRYSMLKNNKYIFILYSTLVALICSVNVHGQTVKDFSVANTNRVYVQYTDSTVEAFCYRGDKNIKTQDNLFYYWYAAQQIKHTRGGYEGKILHGTYTMFYYNKDLLAKGNFKYGLKHGEWKSWHQGGEIKSKEKWRKGVLVGKAYYYSNKGRIQRERNIKPTSGNGYIVYYGEDGILTSKSIYKNNTVSKEINYQKNDKGKLVEVKPEKVKSEKEKTQKGKSKKEKSKNGSKEENKQKTEKPVREKKQKVPKIKIQKYRQISPGGIGA
ncbi:conserved hypothetical protein [Cytophaga hutchinsonii ATCC 33406]|uniref:Uncharacterized protein n=2 Tax=Cytophaga hutchinsonii TaxID=985 RepID=A0A6N4SVN2_CYTH3|nr:conserved hypothetical protein [Cytophaga hutchinsonii ATCC 33406]